MKLPVLFFALGLFSACHPASQDHHVTSAAVPIKGDSVRSYAPGLGEFMLGFQIHHGKLWFAGQGKNWPLADFEIKEIDELSVDIKSYCSDRSEIKYLPMLDPAIDSIKASILEKNVRKFRAAFLHLTKSCNDCHQVVNFPFNIICVPENPPFSNQRYGS